MRDVRVTNSMTRSKDNLVAEASGKVTFYSCGPTVYDLIHIGNLRAALVPDMVYRTLRRLGYEVEYVRNYTDVDDRIIAKAQAEGASSEAIAKRYIQEVELDYAAAGLAQPTRKTLATEHIPEMIVMIQKIIDRGHGYVVQGEVLFSINSFPAYGRLSHRGPEDLAAGYRVEVNSQKRNPLDFTLWKPAKPGEPFWPSPWGPGRPGWHIECSVMATQWLGMPITLHHGGEDLVFPHHENEIAQTEAATGTEPFVRHWIHNAFLNINQNKMSKSLGNVWLARDFIRTFSTEIARLLLLGSHYRSKIEIGDEVIDQALSLFERIYEGKRLAKELVSQRFGAPDPRAESVWGQFVAECEKAHEGMLSAMANDFNTSECLAAFFTLIRELNRAASEPKARATPGAAVGAAHFVKILEDDLGEFLGVGRLQPEKAFEDLARIRAARTRSGSMERPLAEEVEKLILERQEARKARDFARADAIRKDLEGRGIEIKDGPQGVKWEYR